MQCTENTFSPTKIGNRDFLVEFFQDKPNLVFAWELSAGFGTHITDKHVSTAGVAETSPTLITRVATSIILKQALFGIRR